MHQPRVLVIQDISASCRISVNVAVPVLSCLNNGVNVLPTALLSTHTGVGFSDYTFLDLTAEMKKILAHWKTLDIQYDGILIGYLGSLEQIALVKTILDDFLKPGGIAVLDPVMGDHGSLYPGFDENYVNAMRDLCRHVSVLIPNMTETALLLDVPYQTGPFTRDYVADLLTKLTALNKKRAVLTGVRFDNKEVGAASMEYSKGQLAFQMGPLHQGHFDGTGDLFSSVIAGYLFQEKPIAFAVKTAVEYVNRVIVRTMGSGLDLKFGVQFETDLPYLIGQLYQENNEE